MFYMDLDVVAGRNGVLHRNVLGRTRDAMNCMEPGRWIAEAPIASHHMTEHALHRPQACVLSQQAEAAQGVGLKVFCRPGSARPADAERQG